MPRLQFGLSAFVRSRGDGVELPVENMFVEDAPAEERQVSLQSRPGLSDRAANMGSGPVEALFQKSGVLAGLLFGVSSGTLYQGTTSCGAIAGSGPVSIAGNELGLMITAGASVYYWNGSALATVSFPDSASVTKVFAGASRFWAIRSGTGKIYWTDVLVADVDALDFATAESLPDNLLDGLWLDDTAILFGQESVEFWPNTGDVELPIQPLEGRVFEKGIKATGCATKFGTTFAWVTNENEVCVSDADNVISHPGLHVLIEASASCRLWTFWIDGTEFLCLTLADTSWVYSYRSKMWSQFSSNEQDNWVPQCYAGGVFGSSLDGKTLEWNAAHLDLGGPLVRRFRAGMPLNSSGMVVSNLSIRTNPGNTPYLTSAYADPIAEARLSPDGGKTWRNWRQAKMGPQGEYSHKVEWRALGQARRPGLLAEIRCSDPVPFRVSDVLVNEPWG